MTPAEKLTAAAKKVQESGVPARVIEPLAAWLEWAAREAAMNDNRAPRHRTDLTEALAVADAILGSES